MSAHAHRWSRPETTNDGHRHCTKAGCSVRVADSFRRWQAAPRGRWRSWLEAPIPECAGKETP